MRRSVGLSRHDDLFELFPDLPRPVRRSSEGQRARVLNLVAAARLRAAANVLRQQALARQAREHVAARQEDFRSRHRLSR